MIKNKDEIVREFCKDIFFEKEKYIHDERDVNGNFDKTRVVEISENETTLRLNMIKSKRFFKVNDEFMFFDRCDVLEDCMCEMHVEYDQKTGRKSVYYGIHESFILFLAGYSIEDYRTLYMSNLIYKEATNYYSNRYNETGEESPIRYESSSFGLKGGAFTVYCALASGVDVCCGDICGIDSCMECEFMNKDSISYHEGEEFIMSEDKSTQGNK